MSSENSEAETVQDMKPGDYLPDGEERWLSIHHGLVGEEREVVGEKIREAFGELGYDVKYWRSSDADEDEDRRYVNRSTTIWLEANDE